MGFLPHELLFRRGATVDGDHRTFVIIEAGRLRPVSACGLEASVDGDSIQPGPEGRFRTKTLDSVECIDERFLREIGRIALLAGGDKC